MENYNLLANQAQEVATGAQISKLWQEQREKAKTAAENVPVEKAKKEYEQLRYEGLSKYLSPTSTQTPSALSKAAADPADAHFGLTVEQQEAEKEYKQTQQEITEQKNRMSGLSPEDDKGATAKLLALETKSQEAHAKLIQKSADAVNESAGALMAIKDEGSLQGARNYLGRVIAKQAEREHVLPDAVEAYVQNKLNQVLPEKFDAAGKVQVEASLTKAIGVNERLKLRHSENEAKTAEARAKAAEAAGVSAQARATTAAASGRKADTSEQADAEKIDKDLLASTKDRLARPVVTPKTSWGVTGKTVDNAEEVALDTQARLAATTTRDKAAARMEYRANQLKVNQAKSPAKLERELTGQDKIAVEWARSHMSDPRAKTILAKHGISK